MKGNKRWQRIAGILIAAVMVITGIPEFAAIGGFIAQADDVIKISTAEQWNSFAQSTSSTGNVELTGSFTLSGNIVTKAGFSGTFNGNGNTITIAAGSSFLSGNGNNTKTNIGLFNLLGGATIQNVAISLEGDLYSSTNHDLVSDNPGFHAGVLAGMASNTTIRQCAVLTASSNGIFHAFVGPQVPNDANIGGLVGAFGNGTIDQCYVEIGVRGYRNAKNPDTAKMRVAGIAAWVDGATISSCKVYYGDLYAYHHNPGLSDNQAGQVGGIFCQSANTVTLRNDFVDFSYLYVKDVNENTVTSTGFESGQGYGSIGTIAAVWGGNISASNCYANRVNMFNSGAQNSSGATGNAGVSPSGLVSAAEWSNTQGGAATLKWLLTQPTAVTLTPNTESGAADAVLAISPTQKGEKDSYEPAWYYDLSATVMGRQATPSGLHTVTGASASAVNKVEIAEVFSASATDHTYYSGGTYQLNAKVSGVNLTASNLPAVTWRATDGNASAASVVDWVSGKPGRFTIKSDYSGTILITATCGEIPSEPLEITAVKGKLIIDDPATATVQQGGKLAFGATAVLSSGVKNKTLQWSVKGGTGTTEMNKTTGVLTVDKAQAIGNLTVMLSLVDTDGSTILSTGKTTAVTAGEAEPADVSVNIALANPAATAVASVTSGKTLTVNATATKPSTVPDTATVETTYASGTTTVGTMSGNVMSALNAGSTVITVTRTYSWQETTGEAPNAVTTSKSAELSGKVTVTVTAPTVTPDPTAKTILKSDIPASAGTSSGSSVGTNSVQDPSTTLILDGTSSAGCRYLLKSGEGSTTAPSADQVNGIYAGAGIVLSKDQLTAIAGGQSVLWVKTVGNSQLSESRLVGFQLTKSETAITGTPLTAYPADGGYAQKSLALRGQVYDAGKQSVRKILEGYCTANQDVFWKNPQETARQASVEFPALASGEIKVRVWPKTLRFTGRNASYYYADSNASTTIGAVTASPTIRPREDGVLTDDSFTIDIPAGTTVFYNMVKGKTKDQITEADYPTKESTQYTEGTAVPFPNDGTTTLTVLARAYPAAGSNNMPSTVDVVTFVSNVNLQKPIRPELKIGANKEDFYSTATYSEGTIFHFQHPLLSNSGVKLYYTSAASNAPTPDMATAVGQLYDPENPPKFNFGTKSQINIKAIVFDTARGMQSEMLDVTVSRRELLGAPAASIASNTAVRPDEKLYLTLGPTAVSQLSASYSVLKYGAPYDAAAADYTAYDDYTYIDGSPQPIKGISYLIIETESTDIPNLPEIRYLLNNDTGSLDTAQAYQYAIYQVCTVYQSDGSGTVQHRYKRVINPDVITLSEKTTSSKEFKVRAKAYSTKENLNNSPETVFNYSLRGSVTAPRANPSGTIDSPKSIRVGEKISLIGAGDTLVYYTIDGTLPVVSLNEEGKWVPGNSSTKLFEASSPIVVMEEDMLLSINAIAVSADDSLEPTRADPFVYQVAALDQANTPTASPATVLENPTELAKGQTIQLFSSTLNTQIYYTTNGDVPSFQERDEWDAAYAVSTQKGTDGAADPNPGQRWYKSESGNKIYEPNTKIYDRQKPLTMEATEKDPLFTVFALAKDMSSPNKFSPSKAQNFTYTLAKTAAPTATPATSADKITTIEPKSTVNLFSGTSGAIIYYTLDNTLPSVTADIDAKYQAWKAEYDRAAKKGTDSIGRGYYVNSSGSTVYEPSTRKCGADGSIVMPASVTSFFTIRAVAVTADGKYRPSDVKTYSYQPPAPVQAVYANPTDGSSVVKGTKVTLKCSTEGAQIFYKTYTRAPADDDLPLANKDASFSSPIEISRETWIRAVAVRQGVESIVSTYHYKVAGTLHVPQASLPTGSVVYNGMRVRIFSEDGATIAYTTDGSDPKADTSASSSSSSDTTKKKGEGVQYGNSIAINADYGETVVIRAYAVDSSHTPSDTVSFSYTVCEKEEYLKASPATGAVISEGTQINLVSGLTGAKIYYTVNGSSPTMKNEYAGKSDYDYNAGDTVTHYKWAASGDTKSGNSVTIQGSPGQTVSIKATALVDGADGGAVQVFTYTFMEQAPAPTASIPSGAYVMDGAKVSLVVKEGSIYYTTDGSTPTTSSALYTAPIDASQSMVLKAIAVSDNRKPSKIVEYIYTRVGQTQAPAFSTPGGEIDLGTKVTLTDGTSGANIYYSTDGTDPSADNLESLSLYTDPIQITRPVTIKAIAIHKSLHSSVVNTATYTVKEPAAPVPEETNDDVPKVTSADRLSRRTSASDKAGTTFTDVVISNLEHSAVLTANNGVVPKSASLNIREVSPSGSDKELVGKELGYDIIRAYDVTLEQNGEEIQPDGKVEVGLAIPSQYQNGIVVIASISDDGSSMAAYPTRREGGMAYIITDHFSKYVITVPEELSGNGGKFPWIPVVLVSVAALAAIGAIIYFMLKKKKQNALPEGNRKTR